MRKECDCINKLAYSIAGGATTLGAFANASTTTATRTVTRITAGFTRATI